MSFSPVTAAGTAAIVPTARVRSDATPSDSFPLNAVGRLHAIDARGLLEEGDVAPAVGAERAGVVE
jgi:hypothetical protein